MISKKDFLAKSNRRPDGTFDTIERHTDDLLKLFVEFIQSGRYYVEERNRRLIMLAAEYHDLGKINFRFQTFLHKAAQLPLPDQLHLTGDGGADTNIPHGLFSGALIPIDSLLGGDNSLEEEECGILVTAVVNHHTRDMPKDERMLNEAIKTDLAPYVSFYDCKYKTKKLTYLDYNLLAVDFDTRLGDCWVRYAIVKGLLNKLDYAASAYCDHIEIAPTDCAKLVARYLSVKGFALRPCQQYALDKSDKNIVMVASTGIGKTEAAFLWIGERKGFYTLPYTVSLNAIYERLLSQLNCPADKAVLLHSKALEFMLESNADGEVENFQEAQRKEEEAKRLAYPLTVCTIDQLFAFALRARGSEMIAATLSYSAIVIDEIQSYSPDVMAVILAGLKLIDQLGGKFFVMTATMPPFISDWLKANGIDFDSPPPYFSEVVRHVVTIAGDKFDYEEIAREGNEKQVLVICNTVEHAQNAYRELKDLCGNVNLLHARFIGKDKKVKESQVINFTADKTHNGIWVSTQMVEASLDIDFDLLYTEMSTADSLLQRMGRCYRKREYHSPLPNIIVIDNENTGGGHVYDNEIYRRSVLCLGDYVGKPFTEEDKKRYVDEVFNTEKIKKTIYYDKFLKRINQLKHFCAGVFTEKEAQKMIRNINAINAIPKPFHDNAREIAKQLTVSRGEEKKKLLNQLNNLCVSVNKYSKKIKTIPLADLPKGFALVDNGYDEYGLVDYTDEGVFV